MQGVRASMFDTPLGSCLFCITECFSSPNWPQVVANIDAQQVDDMVAQNHAAMDHGWLPTTQPESVLVMFPWVHTVRHLLDLEHLSVKFLKTGILNTNDSVQKMCICLCLHNADEERCNVITMRDEWLQAWRVQSNRW